MIGRLFESHLYVSNLERSAHFYENVLGFQPGHIEEQRRARFYWPGGHGVTMLGIWEVPADQVRRQHIAWEVSLADLKQARAWLEERGAEGVSNFVGESADTLKVFAWMPAVSIYFKDPDGHSLELIAMLPDEAKPELGLVDWPEWEAMHGRRVS
ncbi:MAG TPA: VOC family protein [Symbiobacteriaceae bacterium]|nr:VOC family protein [Symbiobacteriaceae bacterium]